MGNSRENYGARSSQVLLRLTPSFNQGELFMRTIGLSMVSVGAIGALTLAALPAHAQYVPIPITNGNFAITNAGAGLTYSTLPTFLSPAGTINITAASTAGSIIQSPTPITTNTPVGFATFAGGYTGSLNLNDGRTTTFTGASVSLRGTATVTGTPNITLPNGVNFYNLLLPVGATFTYTAQSGALHIPANSPGLSSYSTPQFTIPVSGGSFTLTESPGTSNATITINSLLSPLGTTNLTFSSPNLSRGTAGFPFAFYPTPTLTTNLGGMADGTVALNDGKTASVANRLVHLQATTQVVTLPPGQYIQGARLLATPVTIQGTITGGSISVPESAVTMPPAPVQPQPVVTLPTPVVVQPVPQPTPQPKQQEFALGFATNLNLGGEPEEYLRVVELEPVPVAPEDLPEVEQSSLAYSRLHPVVNAYSR
ncbi:MAG: hypothetical protein NW224_17360 [Leptolyngbyaceae cyanobacterium bins.302]|nr:hypothetical protein [Leptolyngbyaceae cyanobacterium bins.302]